MARLPRDGTDIRDFTLRMVSSQARTESPYSLVQSVVAHPGERWEADVTLRAMKREKANAWLAFFAGLRGMEGTFEMGDPDNVGLPAGAKVAAAPAGSTSINLSGNGLLLPGGSMIGIGGRMYMLADAVPLGGASVGIWPRLRSDTTNGQNVETLDPVTSWRMVTPEQGYPTDSLGIYRMAFVAVEAIS